jgi:DNA mismatch repair protein MSH2
MIEASEDESSHIAVSVTVKDKQIHVGASVLSRIPRQSMEDKVSYCLTVFDFLDGDHFSNLDAFLLQYREVSLFLSDDLEDGTRGLGKKINCVVQGKDNLSNISYVKKSVMSKKTDAATVLTSLVGVQTHELNTAEMQSPLAYSCIEGLLTSVKVSPRILTSGTVDDCYCGKFSFKLGSLSSVMRLDSAAAEAVNLLPRSDHPSKFGSIYGVLNRGVTKMGSRLLERWLRQPLVDEVEINKRLDLVEILKDDTICRTSIADALKKCPDVDTIIAKMTKKNAGLTEMHRLYVFTKALPLICEALVSCVNDNGSVAASSECDTVPARDGAKYRVDDGKMKSTFKSFDEKLLEPLEKLSDKFSMYQKLVEHVIDFSQLPDLVVNSELNEDLKELSNEKRQVMKSANTILDDANSGWANFADVKLESSSVHALFLRTAKADDERELRANKKSVKILSILKNGVHFTTPELEELSERIAGLDEDYAIEQKGVVEKAVETACTYLPLAEAVSAVIAELDVIVGFATAAALSPVEYCRPTVTAKGGGIVNLKGARHPCVELMEGVDFISNDYNLVRGKSDFQVVTGPNMGGKSTYIRGVGSIVTMAQAGSFVPCEKADISVVDSILARVGAGDAVSKGVSTFMAEMLEAAVILQTSTKDSLIIIDELGRGTSTFDGFGIAWAISEYMIKNKGCLCLFATHFHELTALSRQFPSVVNKHVTAVTQNNEVVMLYQINDGPCAESFGIHIAATADFPDEVIAVAKRKSQELEHVGTDSTSEEGRKRHKIVTESLGAFGALEAKVMENKALVDQVRTTFTVTP